MKPYSLMRAKQESDEISPMFDLRASQSADAAIMRGVNVADFKSGALAAQTAWSSAKDALMRNLGKRVV